VRRALLPAEVVKEVGFTVKEQPTISKETFFYGCDSALTAEKLLITAGYQELRDSSRTVFQGVSYLPPGGAAGSVNEAPKLTRCASYTLDELVHDQLQVQDLAAVTGFDALYSWCERVDGRQYSCVSVAAKGDLLLQMYSVANPWSFPRSVGRPARRLTPRLGPPSLPPRHAYRHRGRR
jgi:hypothetical protein